MEKLLSDSTTYVKLKKDPGKAIERKTNSRLLLLKKKGKILESFYFTLRSTDVLSPRLYRWSRCINQATHSGPSFLSLVLQPTTW